MSGHTPGPWVIEGDVAVLPCDVGVSVVNRNHDGDDWDVALVGSSVANARLIAAAPDLLAVAKRIADVDWCIGYEITPDMADQFDQARVQACQILMRLEGTKP
jgi:hypothetical protein